MYRIYKKQIYSRPSFLSHLWWSTNIAFKSVNCSIVDSIKLKSVFYNF